MSKIHRSGPWYGHVDESEATAYGIQHKLTPDGVHTLCGIDGHKAEYWHEDWGNDIPCLMCVPDHYEQPRPYPWSRP